MIQPQPSKITDEAVEAACASYAYHRYGGEIPWPEGFAEDLKQQDVRAHMRAALEAAGRVAEQPQPGTITAEHHERAVREAVKAAYERAAEKCAETHDFHIRGSCKDFEDGYSEGCNSCKDAIRALGESDE